ncbi:MAG: metallophosphoesterase family protein [bacterium]
MDRIAVISDIHGNITALETVAGDIKRRMIQTVINLGDHLSGPLWPKETIQFLMKQDWIHISGNHDRQLTKNDPATHGPSDSFTYKLLDDEDKDWLKSLPSEKYFDDEIYLCHGAPGNDHVYLLETVENGRARLSNANEIIKKLNSFTSKIILCGHTHVPGVVQLNNIMIVNPGSVGLQAYDDVTPEPHIIENGSPHARYMILEKRDNNWFTELIFIPYDYDKAAEQARKNNRPDWEVALRTGYMKF